MDEQDAGYQFQPVKNFLLNVLLAWLLLVPWGAITCMFLEGKSAFDLAFTLWNDEFAKVPMQPMGEIILPQLLHYGAFIVISGGIAAIFLNPSRARGFILVTAMLVALLLVLFAIAFAMEQAGYLGVRQGPAGWTILENPWLSVFLLCAGQCSGIAGLWILVAQETQRIPFAASAPASTAERLKTWLIWSNAWRARIAVVLGTVLGSLGTSIFMTLALNDATWLAMVGIAGAAGSIIVLVFHEGFPVGFVRKRCLARTKPGAAVKVFSRDELVTKDHHVQDNWLAFTVNPRNLIWRRARNVLNGLLQACCTGLMAAMCYMTVPDEWVFQRTVDLLPWMLLGIVAGIVIVTTLPEPSVFYPATVVHIFAVYEGFLADFSSPFSPEFVMVNGIVLGFWIAALFTMQFQAYRAHDAERNAFLAVFTSLAWACVFMLVCFVDRFQHDGQMVQDPITEGLAVAEPVIMGIAEGTMYASLAFWALDFIYRGYRLKHPRQKLDATTIPARRHLIIIPVVLPKMLASFKRQITQKRRAIVVLAIAAGFMGTMAMVQGIAIHGNYVQPLLARDDTLGIWSVNGVVKVERSFPVSLAASAPRSGGIEIAAARGEWEGWHVIVTAQQGKDIAITNITCTDFKHSNTPDSINSSAIEYFLVGYLVDEQPDQLFEVMGDIHRSGGEHADFFWRVRVPTNAAAGEYESEITYTINATTYTIVVTLTVFDFTLPQDNHLRTAFGGGWQTEEWFDELEYIRISQYNMGIPFLEGNTSQYWWNETEWSFSFNWTAYDAAFQAQLDRGFTGIRQGYFPRRPASVTNDTEWASIERTFLEAVSAHLESKTWLDATGENHSWIEIPYNYWTDEPPVDRYPRIREVNDRYHAGTSNLRTLLTEEYLEEYPILHECVDIWCPVIGNFKPEAAANRHAAGQEYWFYVCVGPTAPYPNLQLWEAGHNPRLLPYICAAYNADGFLYWSQTTGNSSYRAGFDGNGDGQVSFVDPNTGRSLPSLRLLSFCAGIEDYEYIWLMRKTVEKQGEIGAIPGALVERINDMERRLTAIAGNKIPQYTDHELGTLLSFRADLANLLVDLWPFSQLLYV